MVTIEEFLECYKRLENAVAVTFPRDKNKQRIVECLTENHVSGIDWPRLRKLRSIRNAFSHNSCMDGDVAGINDSANEFLRMVTESVLALPKVGNVCKPIKKVFFCGLDTLISDVVAGMVKSVFSHVPVLDAQDKVIGVFSESTMLEMHKSGWTHKNTAKIKSISDLLPVSRHKADEFPFVAMSAPVSYLCRLTSEALAAGKRIGMFLVTENGQEDEPLAGILTVWDIVGVSDSEIGNR